MHSLFSHFKQRNSHRKSTIVIEEQDSLLQDSNIKNFIENGQSNKLKYSRQVLSSEKYCNIENKSQQNQCLLAESSQMHQRMSAMMKNQGLIKFANTSQGFFKNSQFNQNYPKTNKIKNPHFKIAQISRMQLPVKRMNKMMTQRFIPKMGIQLKGQNSPRLKSNTSILITKRSQINDLIQNKKQWSAEYLKKSLSASRFKLQQKNNKIQRFSTSKSDLNLSSLSIKQNPYCMTQGNTFLTQKQKISSSQNNLKSKLSKQAQFILQNVSNSTWMKLNPENIKYSLIKLSKCQKSQRKTFFATKQAQKLRQCGLKQVNKKIMLRNLSLKTLNKQKQANQFDGLITKNLSSKHLTAHKLYQKKEKMIQEQQRRGIFKRNPLLKQNKCLKHDVLTDPLSLYIS